MALRYQLVELHGGPLNGQLVQAPVAADGRPEPVIGVPVPVLDQARELFWWDTGTYFMLSAANPPKRGGCWWYAYARTLPGYPTLSRDFTGPG